LLADHDIRLKVDQLDELAGHVLRPGVFLRDRAVGLAETLAYAEFSPLPASIPDAWRPLISSAPRSRGQQHNRVRVPAGFAVTG
jgi:hypothetical protein